MLENIISGVIATFICTIIVKVWSNFKMWIQGQPTEREIVNLKTTKLSKIQFYSCLIYLILVLIALISGLAKTEMALSFISVTTLFAFILIWGAFDVVHNELESRLKKEKQQISNKDTDSDS